MTEGRSFDAPIFIVNPAAGRRRGRDSSRLIEQITARFPTAAIRLTERAGQAEALARSYAPESVWVVAVGGDGTVSEVARGLVGGQAMMGVVPVGSGNDFARMLGLSGQLATALEQLASARASDCDVGQAMIEHDDGTTTRHQFVNSLGLGFEAVVADSAAQARVFSGFWRYLAAALRHLPFYRSPAMTLRYENTVIAEPQFLVAIGNGRWAGGGFMLTPNAVLDDGWLELTRAEALPLWRLLTILPRVFGGRHLECAGVHADKVQAISIDCPDGCMVHADGEVIARMACQIRVELLPAALRVLR